MLIKLGYWRNDWENLGIKTSVYWDTKTVNSLMIAGITGGGKSVLGQLIANQLLGTDAKISICDYKAGGDWSDIVPNYGEYKECDKVFDDFYNDFLTAVKLKATHEDRYLFFDEFSSYALSKDTKRFRILMDKVSSIAFMGRSFGYHLIFISQNFNAKVLDTAIREQFGIKIYMGSTISTESATMLFPNCDIDKSKHLMRCCGYISMPEKEIGVLQIPYIREPEKLKKLLEYKGQGK